MINQIISSALSQRFLVLLAAVGLLAYGVYSARLLNLDAFPDVTNIQVQVNTEGAWACRGRGRKTDHVPG